MIAVGPIANFMSRGVPVRSTHLLSDLTGNLGTKELMGFAIEIGLKAGWLQNGNTETEHFDLMGKKIDAAIKAGAVRVDRYRLVKIIQEKRAYRMRREREKETA